MIHQTLDTKKKKKPKILNQFQMLSMWGESHSKQFFFFFLMKTNSSSTQ